MIREGEIGIAALWRVWRGRAATVHAKNGIRAPNPL